MVTKIANKSVVKDLVKQLEKLEYDIVRTDETYIAYEGDRVIMRALQHSSGRNYLLQYDNSLIK